LKQREETLNVIQTYLSPEMVDLIDSLDNLGLTGEERVISVVFADVRGFTTYSETLPPEQLLQAINQYLSIGADAIQSYAGIIDKYMGDAIVGLYNTQLNMQEDHALRAVQAAIDMVRWVKELHKHLSPEDHLACGIGVHTDWAMLGNVGSPSRKEFTALGHAVNYAKKLQEIALGHEVIISKQTYEIVSAWIEAEFVERETRSGDAILQGYRVIF
jgi:adenylate cyclase